jgi:Uma2 family endonuclease
MDQVPTWSAADSVPIYPTRKAYLAWSLRQTRGRTERVWGEVVRMNPQTIGHAQINVRVWRALDRAIAEARVPCLALGNGVTVSIGEHTDYEPDAVVNCGAPLRRTQIAVRNPVIVVEVASRSTKTVDAGVKLVDYFTVPSIAHCVIVDPAKRRAIHYARVGDGVGLRGAVDGMLRFDPPGITVNVADFFVDLAD